MYLHFLFSTCTAADSYLSIKLGWSTSPQEIVPDPRGWPPLCAPLAPQASPTTAPTRSFDCSREWDSIVYTFPLAQNIGGLPQADAKCMNEWVWSPLLELNFPKWMLSSLWTGPRWLCRAAVNQGSKRRMLTSEEQNGAKGWWKEILFFADFPHLWDSFWNLEVVLEAKLNVWFQEGSGRPGVSCKGLAQSTLPGRVEVPWLEGCSGLELTVEDGKQLSLLGEGQLWTLRHKCQLVMPPSPGRKFDISGLQAFFYIIL